MLFSSCAGQWPLAKGKPVPQAYSAESLTKIDNICLVKLEIISPHMEPFERVEEFKYLGTTLANQNSVQEEIKSRLKSGNACHRSVQYHLSYSLLSKNIKIKI